MPHPNPKLDQSGKAQTYLQRISAQMNWALRLTKGFAAQSIIHHNHLWIKAHPEYKTALTQERRDMLRDIELQATIVKSSVNTLAEMIEKYHTLPKMPKQNWRHKAKDAQASI